jgi:hypothetical protein
MSNKPFANTSAESETGFYPTATPLVGAARDEIAAQVSRLRQADTRLSQPAAKAHNISPADRDWAEGQNLPAEFFDYFTLQRVA